jgi:hypothetical protein
MRARTILLVLLAACGSGRQSDDDSAAPERHTATVEVENRAFPDMTVYVIEGVQRQRLGVAPGNTTTALTIPERLIGRGAPLRFYCDPIGGRGLPVTEQISVEPGDTVQLTIPPS